MKKSSQKFWEKASFPILFILTILILLLLISIQLFNLTTYDETLYLTHMRLIMEGKIPYHDFFDWVPPVWLYLYAGVFSIFGENVTVARIFSTLLGISSIGLTIRLAWKSSGRLAALIALAIITFVYPIANELTRFYYTASAFFYVILALTIADALPRKKISVITVEILFTLAAGTVQAFGLLILLYPIYLLAIGKDKKNALLAFCVGLIAGGLIAAPFLLVDYQATIWAMFSYSKEIIPIRWDYSWKTYLGYIGRSFATYPIIWLPIIYFVITSIWQWWKKRKIEFRFEKNRPESYFLLWMAYFGISFAVLLFNPTMFMQQHVYYLPIGAVLVAGLLVPWFDNFNKNQRIAAAIILVICFSASMFFSKVDFMNSISNARFALREQSLDRVVSTTRDLTKDYPNARVFSFVPYFGIEAGKLIFPGTEYGISSFTLNWSEEKAARYNFFTGTQTINWIETSKPDLIIMLDKSSRTMACCGPKNGVEFLEKLETTIPEYYVQVDSFFVNEYWGEARFFKRKSDSNK
jgi:hypothetical protein